ncbi:chorismate-binding protein [Staphylococcus sp. 17KM0847]|uniref:chorismate-binding protein n=1 Tax=Staphylococcus sp. 17KM0847 TaxID=2583989 RepID=UPI0015DD489C|nr:chorismate-binding protein [Staphylococcus sp. 17KM0847]QLK85494.1 aminodeoxychorismate synthase component I [Staphylococcus sp. 17KM0847]
MVVIFDYTYYKDEKTVEKYHYTFDNPIEKHIARTLEEVGTVVEQAEKLQKEGYYVALYLPYEAASYYQSQFQTYQLVDEVYAVCYAFDRPCSKVKTSNTDVGYKLTMPSFVFSQIREEVMSHICDIQHEIIEGWTYQVNYTTRLVAQANVSIGALYHELTKQANGNYTVLFDTEEIKVASISPELFFQFGRFEGREGVVVSKPMKGTMPRGHTAEEDIVQYNKLKHSSKDRAENIMIVDLLRNDIARIAKQGTVNVKQLCAIETYPTVYQMTTMVTGEVAPQMTLNDMLTGLFPCGSITGAPKVHTMAIIHRLESTPRYIYCGTIGLLRPQGNAIFNVPIRTVQQRGDQFIYGVGAGITIDSDPVQEYKEFQDKTKILKG